MMRVFAVPKSIAISCVKKLNRPIGFYSKIVCKVEKNKLIIIGCYLKR